MSASQPQAQAVAIKGNRFLLAGSDADVRKTCRPATKRIDLRGRTVLPGLEDSHTHPITAALSEQDGPIPVMNSIADIQAYIRSQAATQPADRVIFVPKIYSTRLIDRRYPTRYEIDEAAPGRLAMTDNGYASVLNSTRPEEAEHHPRYAAAGRRQDHQGREGRAERPDPGRAEAAGQPAPERARQPRRQDLGAEGMQKSYNAVGMTSTIDRGEACDGFRVYQGAARQERADRAQLRHLSDRRQGHARSSCARRSPASPGSPAWRRVVSRRARSRRSPTAASSSAPLICGSRTGRTRRSTATTIRTIAACWPCRARI